MLAVAEQARRGFSEMRTIVDDITGLEDGEYMHLVEDMCREDDACGLILVLDKLARRAITTWQSAATSGSIAVNQAG
jgi:hypothetical protein